MNKKKNDYIEHRSHKYISREWRRGRWNYTYPNEVKAKAVGRQVPDVYQPDMKPDTFGSRKGYTYKGIFYDGNYNQARARAYERDLQEANAKAIAQLREQNYRRSVQKKIDDLMKSIREEGRKVCDLSADWIEKGSKKLVEILRDTADKLES